MFSFRLDKKKFNSVIPLFGNFIDVVYINNKVIIASEDGICYCQLMFDATSDTPNSKEGFRIETSVLKKMAQHGRVEVYCSDTEVTISMFGEGQDVLYRSSTPMMNSFLEFDEVLAIMDKFSDYDYNEIKTESGIIKLASKYNEPIVSEGKFFYIYHNNSYIFCKSELPPFCVDGRAFKNITSLVTRFKLIEDYVVFLEENLLVRLRRNKMPLLSDLSFIVEGKAIAKYDVDFKRASLLVNSLGAEEYTSELNLTVGKLSINSNKGRFEAKVELLDNNGNRINNSSKEVDNRSVEDKLKALQNITNPSVTKSTIDRVIKIPKWVYSVISEYYKLTFFVKRNTTIVKFGNNLVVFQGGFVS